MDFWIRDGSVETRTSHNGSLVHLTRLFGNVTERVVSPSVSRPMACRWDAFTVPPHKEAQLCVSLGLVNPFLPQWANFVLPQRTLPRHTVACCNKHTVDRIDDEISFMVRKASSLVLVGNPGTSLLAIRGGRHLWFRMTYPKLCRNFQHFFDDLHAPLSSLSCLRAIYDDLFKKGKVLIAQLECSGLKFIMCHYC